MAEQEQPAPGTSLTLPQRAAVALASSETETKLRELVKSSTDIVAVIDPAGREQAHRIAMTLKNARCAIEKTSKTAREDAVAFSKAIIKEEVRLIEIVTAEEDRVFKLRDEFDIKVAAEKAAKARIEAERVAAIRAKIDAIRARPMRLSGEASEDIKAVAMDLAAMQIAETEYAEFTEEVTRVVDEVGQELTTMFQGALAREQAEAEAARLLAEEQARVAAQAEANRLEGERLEKLRIEAEAVEAERQRIAAEEEAERQRVARETKAQMEEMAAELGKKRREQEQVDAARREAEARRENLMAELQALQHQTVIAVTGRAPYCTGGDVRSFLHVLEETRAWDVSESYFGELAGMAQMVKNSVLVTLEQGLKDHLAAELPAAHEEAISMNIAFDMDLPAAKMPYPLPYEAQAASALPPATTAESTIDSSPVVAEKLPCGELCDIAELVVLDTRLTDHEIIAMVADYYHLTTLEAVDRLAQIDFVAARAREQVAA